MVPGLMVMGPRKTTKVHQDVMVVVAEEAAVVKEEVKTN
jgi:hypothetical protein